MRRCGSCGNAISDGQTIYGARYVNKPFCSEHCAEYADLNYKAEEQKKERLMAEFSVANNIAKSRGNTDAFFLLCAKPLCEHCIHMDCCVAQNTTCYPVYHCKFFIREEEGA